MGPVTTGLGEVLMYVVDYEPAGTKANPKIAGKPGFQPDGSYISTDGKMLTDEVSKLGYLRTVQDWVIRPQLKTVAGVAGIDSIGGYEKQFVVEPDPAKLATYHISFSSSPRRWKRPTSRSARTFVERGGEAFLVKRRWPHPHAR
jgi:cobalt-zinc-cadmium resistance protein CzcA